MIGLGRFALVGVALCALVGCSGGKTTYDRFNADDFVTVQVTASADLGEPVSVDLVSTTGAVIIGTATVDPGSGPVGTDHTVTVDVLPDYAEDVAKVVIQTDAGARGVEDHDMIQDSAEHGRWWRVLTSMGETGEVRTDTLTFQLFSASADTDNGGILP